MTTTVRDNNIIGLNGTHEGLLIHNSTDSEFNYWNGSAWIGFPGGDDACCTRIWRWILALLAWRWGILAMLEFLGEIANILDQYYSEAIHLLTAQLVCAVKQSLEFKICIAKRRQPRRVPGHIPRRWVWNSRAVCQRSKNQPSARGFAKRKRAIAVSQGSEGDHRQPRLRRKCPLVSKKKLPVGLLSPTGIK
ncbi:MAG: hypothetical protein GY751_24200 [Bacteroidetes bacterium]|nr:hypothetical protein [Bacteroidota bacterium]